MSLPLSRAVPAMEHTFKEGNFHPFSNHHLAVEHALHGRAHSHRGAEGQLRPPTISELPRDLIPTPLVSTRLPDSFSCPLFSVRSTALPIASIGAPSRRAVARGVVGAADKRAAELSAVYTLSLSLGSQTSELLSMKHTGNITHLIYLANYFQTTRLRKTSIKDNSSFVTVPLLASGELRALALPRKRCSPAAPALTWKSYHYLVATNS